jgi:hypothetical protein
MDMSVSRWVSATAQVAIEVSANSGLDQTYRSLALALMTALNLRSCLITVRDRETNHDHVSMAMIRLNRHLPNGRPTYASQHLIQDGPDVIPIADNPDGPHLNMHSVAAWTRSSLTVVDDHLDPIIKRITARHRYIDEWVNKTSFFVNWYDGRDVPLCTASFGIRPVQADELRQELDSIEWSELYQLIGQRLIERRPDPVELDGLSDRDIEMLTCVAQESVVDGADKLNITVESYRRRRRALARRMGVAVDHLPTEGIRCILQA